MKRWAVLLVALIMLMTGAAAGESTDGAFPEMNGEGFLDSGEFLYENADDGIWRYASSTLWVEIIRYTQKKPARVWYEAEIRCAEDSEIPHMIPNDPEKWMKSEDYPFKIARKNGTVIALSSDYAHLRIKQKSTVGIVIRNGEIISEKTKKEKDKKFPVLDMLAIWKDGDMKVYGRNEITAQELADSGAQDVLAFGPWLIRDGQLNETAIKKFGTSHAQRTAVGMAEKGHYWFMMLEGRIKRSNGDGIGFLAEKLLERGCTVGFNLDGGQTSSIVFMGHQLCKMNNSNSNISSRRTADILGVGTSELLPALDDPW